MRLTTVGATVGASIIDGVDVVVKLDAPRVGGAEDVGVGAARDDDCDVSSESISCALWIGGEGVVLRRARRLPVLNDNTIPSPGHRDRNCTICAARLTYRQHTFPLEAKMLFR